MKPFFLKSIIALCIAILFGIVVGQIQSHKEYYDLYRGKEEVISKARYDYLKNEKKSKDLKWQWQYNEPIAVLYTVIGFSVLMIGLSVKELNQTKKTE